MEFFCDCKNFVRTSKIAQYKSFRYRSLLTSVLSLFSSGVIHEPCCGFVRRFPLKLCPRIWSILWPFCGLQSKYLDDTPQLLPLPLPASILTALARSGVTAIWPFLPPSIIMRPPFDHFSSPLTNVLTSWHDYHLTIFLHFGVGTLSMRSMDCP